MWIPLLPSLAVSGLRLAKEEGEDVNSHRSARNRRPHSRQVTGRQPLSKPHRHSRSEAAARSCAIARASCCYGRENCQQGRGTVCGLRCSHPDRTKNATENEAEKCNSWMALSPSFSCFVIVSNLRIPFACHAKWSHLLHWMHTWKPFACSSESSRNAGIYFAQQKTEPAETRSFGSGESLPELFSKPILGQGGEETSSSIYHRRFAPVTAGAPGHFEYGPCSTTSRFCIGAANSTRWKSCRIFALPRSIEGRQAKEDSERETCECVVWCWKQPSQSAASDSHRFCGKGQNILSGSSEKDEPPSRHNWRWHRNVFQVFQGTGRCVWQPLSARSCACLSVVLGASSQRSVSNGRGNCCEDQRCRQGWRQVMSIHSKSGLVSCCNFVSCSCW